MRISKHRQEMGEEAWQIYQLNRRRKKDLKYRKKHPESYALYKQNTKLKLIEYKGGKCEICGYAKPVPTSFAFHHKDPTQKEFTISASSKGFKSKQQEVDKCQLLCQNCHAEVHYSWYLNQKQLLIQKLKSTC